MTHISVPYNFNDYVWPHSTKIRVGNHTYISDKEDSEVINLLNLYKTIDSYITDNDEELAEIKQLILEKVKKAI